MISGMWMARRGFESPHIGVQSGPECRGNGLEEKMAMVRGMEMAEERIPPSGEESEPKGTPQAWPPDKERRPKEEAGTPVEDGLDDTVDPNATIH
jgi:hypothetical protein